MTPRRRLHATPFHAATRCRHAANDTLRHCCRWLLDAIDAADFAMPLPPRQMPDFRRYAYAMPLYVSAAACYA